MSNEELVKLYGPFKEIWRERESELIKDGDFQHILTITSEDTPYEFLPEDDRPSKEELKVVKFEFEKIQTRISKLLKKVVQ